VYNIAITQKLSMKKYDYNNLINYRLSDKNNNSNIRTFIRHSAEQKNEQRQRQTDNILHKTTKTT